MSARANGVRVFAALELPPEFIDRLTAVLEAVRRAAPADAVRWVRPEGVHLTLQFYGEVPRPTAAELGAMLAGAARAAAPLSLTLEGLGAFPNLTRPRVVWVGVGGDLPGLRRLYAAIVAGARPLGFTPEARGFAPHLTLGRVNLPLRPQEHGRLANALAQTTVPPGAPVTVDTLCLMRSDLRPGGAVYTPLASHGLGR